MKDRLVVEKFGDRGGSFNGELSFLFWFAEASNTQASLDYTANNDTLVEH